MKTVYIKAKSVKALVKQNGKQSTPSFLFALDKKLEQLVLESIKKVNGSKRLTAIEVSF